MREKTEEDSRKVAKAEQVFRDTLIANGIKFRSIEYYKYQTVFFSGAMSVLDYIPPKWGIMLVSRREIIEEYKLNG